jgi:hypothetical protein
MPTLRQGYGRRLRRAKKKPGSLGQAFNYENLLPFILKTDPRKAGICNVNLFWQSP